tara:strand:- start:1278 stop:1676 length:399 start_codon:yes stop_codon:yes gene_type:complete
MNIEKNIKNFLFFIFSRKRFNLLFLLLLILVFSFILYNNNNVLIEGNTMLSQQFKKFNNVTTNGANRKNTYKETTTRENNKGNKIINETFVENMDCSDSNFFNYDKKNTASTMINNVCNSTRNIGKDHKIIE